MSGGNFQASWFVPPAAALTFVVVSAIVIALVIALIGRRGRAVASILLTVGLLVFFLLAATRFVAHDRVRAVDVNVKQQLAQAEWALVGESAGQPAAMAEPLAFVKLGETPSPSKPAGDDDKPKPESPEAATDDSSAPDKTSSTEEAKSEPPPPDDDRPDWVDATKPFKDGGVYKVHVTVGPWPTSVESKKLLPAAVDKEIAKYAVARTGNKTAAKLKLPHDYVMTHLIAKDVWEESLKIDSFDDVKHMVGRDVWEDSANAADGEWTQLHVLVKFDDEVNRRLDDAWAGLIRVERLFSAGVLGAIVMIVLAAVYAYLQIDLKTGGAYRGRLRAGALAAILALIVIVLLNTA